jgi:tRNA (guanine-N7-)-methyltransferase
LPLEQLQPYLIDLPACSDPLSPVPPVNWKALFGNDRPVELEVGFGKGLFLLTSALAHPEINFAGIEIERKYVLYTATRIAKRRLANVRLAHGDARDFISRRVPASSVHTVHVYFPDPWWKKRHHKRRVFTEEFARQCARVLVPGGILSVATDVEEYFAVITELLAIIPEFRKLPPPEEHEPQHDLDYLTNYERKARKVGTAVHRARYARARDDVHLAVQS